MLPTSTSRALPEPRLIWTDADHRAASPDLSVAFADFMKTSARLERSYAELQREVKSVRGELLQRNADLRASVAQNQRMRQSLEELVDVMPCGVVVLEADGVASLLNAEALRLLGVTAGADKLQLSAKLAEVLPASLFCHSTAEVREFECETCVEEAGRQRWLQVRRRILPGQAGRVGAQYLLMVRDVSAARAAERDREEGRQALAHAEISTMLAHEVRNPLASLELFAEMIQQDETRRPEWISHLRAGIRSLSGTVNNVLTFYGTQSWPESSVCVAKVMADAVAFLKPLAEQSGIDLRESSEPAMAAAVVHGNADALRQLMLNLIANAVRHASDAGSVEVRLVAARQGMDGSKQTGRASVMLECRDTGCGVPQDLLGKIFEPGFSIAGTSAGLGLTVCRRIAERHRGTLTAHNREGGGATFRLLLPLTAVTTELEVCA